MGGIERERRQPDTHISRYDRGDGDLAACALGTHMHEDGVWRNRSAIISGLGRSRACGYLLSIPRAAVHRSECDDKHGQGHHAGKPNAAHTQPGPIPQRRHHGPATRLTQACHAKKFPTAISTSMISFSRRAQALLTLRPVGSLDHPRRPLSRGFDRDGYPSTPPASYRANRPLPGWDFHPRGGRAVQGAPKA